MEPTTNQTYEYQEPTGSGAHKAWKIIGGSLIAVLLVVGIITGVVLTNREAANQASAATGISGNVAIVGGAYLPETISIKKGQGVIWTNQDGRRTREIVATTDDATQSLRGFGTGAPLAKGESYSYVFEQAGTFHYYDSTASQTIGTVIVTQ